MTSEIVMCMYNGEKYIIKQLESIVAQTKKVDKITIYDDCSTDNTVNMVREFVADNEINNCEIVLNESNKGWRRGFYDAIVNSTKDIVFFADQDDYWRPNKIEVMSAILEKNPQIMVLNAGFKTIDAGGDYIESKLNVVTDFNNELFEEKAPENFSSYNWKNRIGCAMAIDSRMRELVVAAPFGNWFAHDMFCVNVASLCRACYMVNFWAIDYRLHDNNCSDKLKISRRDNLGLQYLLKLQQIVLNYQDMFPKEQIDFINNYILFIAKRDKVLSTFAPFTLLSLLSKMEYYARGKKGWLADCMDMLHLRKMFIKLGLAHE